MALSGAPLFTRHKTLLYITKNMEANNNKQLCILGIGDAGIKSAQILLEHGVKAIYLGIGNSSHVPEGMSVVHFESPKREFIPGVHRFLVSDMSVEAQLPPDVDALIQNDYYFLLFSGLGGFTGTKFTWTIVGNLIQAGKAFICMVSYPFSFEGTNRSQNADLFVSEFGNHEWIRMLRLDDLQKHGDLLLSQAFAFADLNLAQMANLELQLNIKIEFPQIIKPDRKSLIRLSHLEALSKKIQQANGSLDWIDEDD